MVQAKSSPESKQYEAAGASPALCNQSQQCGSQRRGSAITQGTQQRLPSQQVVSKFGHLLPFSEPQFPYM